MKERIIAYLCVNLKEVIVKKTVVLLFLMIAGSLTFDVNGIIFSRADIGECDSMTTGGAASQSQIAVDSAKKQGKGLLSKIITYFSDANKTKNSKRFDVNFIGGPHYASDTKLGLGIVGAGLYRMPGASEDAQPSNVSLYGDVSTTGFYLMGIRGNNLFPQDRYRINYSLNFYSFPTYYWGIGFENGNNNDNKTRMKRFQSLLKIEFLCRILPSFYMGPVVNWNYVQGKEVENNLNLFEGMDLTTRNYGVGLTLEYDTRDLMNNASRGIYLKISEIFRPKFLWNDYVFSTTTFRASYYHRAWKGAIVAADARCTLNFGNPSWAMMAMVGDSGTMRGYYEGRYRDKSMWTAQVELRQRVWRRSGAVVWMGLGSVFHDSRIFKHILPNYGIGYRWEFKKRVNVRLDCGFGKAGQNGFLFNVNEAF